MEMINLALKTGFSFKETFLDIKNILHYENGTGTIGIADSDGSFGFYFLEKLLKKTDIKPIYGVRIKVVKDGTIKVPPRGQFGCEYIFLARNALGIKEIYNLIKINYQNFYYRGQVSFSDVLALSKNVIVIAEDVQSTDRLDYVAVTVKTPRYMIEVAREEGIPLVAVNTNWYGDEGDCNAYELLVGSRNSELQTYPQHILTTEEFKAFQKKRNLLTVDEVLSSISNTHVIAGNIDKFQLPKAPMIKSSSKQSVEFLCKLGAKRLGIDITQGVYKERYDREIKLIKEKEFEHYFLIVADMISQAKKKMLVGPGRGSAGGSLVCFLMGITETLDPVKYDLMFERFIDITRSDLPDIDVDFPDTKRQSVIKQLIKDYGDDHVKHIANISTMQAKSAIGEFAKGLRIPLVEVDKIKDDIVKRSSGDARAHFCIADTLAETDSGREFIRKYPAMELATHVENHPSHTSTHAAGVVVCNDPIHWYVGTNARDNTAMVEKVGAEYLGLLKIDILGLRTLSILEDCAKMLKMDFRDYYSLPLDDSKTFLMLSENRTSGVFQFEGDALKQITKKMSIENFNDMIAITALARPGALHSGGASRYVSYRIGEKEPVFMSDLHREITGGTFGIVVYQEQILDVCRKIGQMSWEDTNSVRKALSKSLGKEYFKTYKEKFIKGSMLNGHSEVQSEFLWGEVEYAGNYAFNKSHAASYSLISYWTAYMKANHPKEFTVANLRNSKDDESAIKILRDAVSFDGLEYQAIDSDESGVEWAISSSGKIIGGLTNIKGVGLVKAREVIKMREGERKYTPSIVKMLMNPRTPFDILWPCDHFFGDIYKNPFKHGLGEPPTKLDQVNGAGTYLVIGQLKTKNLINLNSKASIEKSIQNKTKRNGEIYTENIYELSMRIEDDTDSIMVYIGRFKFDELKAMEIIENGVEDEDYYIVKASITGESRYLKAEMIMKLDKYEYGVEKEIENDNE